MASASYHKTKGDCQEITTLDMAQVVMDFMDCCTEQIKEGKVVQAAIFFLLSWNLAPKSKKRILKKTEDQS